MYKSLGVALRQTSNVGATVTGRRVEETVTEMRKGKNARGNEWVKARVKRKGGKKWMVEYRRCRE